MFLIVGTSRSTAAPPVSNPTQIGAQASNLVCHGASNAFSVSPSNGIEMMFTSAGQPAGGGH
jgi:hypothetical protein